MAEKSTIARPYAQAAFDLAQERNELHKWSEFLHALREVVASDEVGPLVGNPSIPREVVAEAVIQVGGIGLDTHMQNFVQLLAEKGRLRVIEEITELFEAQRAEVERTVQAAVISAFSLDEGQQKQVMEALKERTGREVSLHCEVDEGLLGGAIIRAGDMVIDGSIQGQLTRLQAALSR